MPCGNFDDTLLRLQTNDPSLTCLDITRFSHTNPADWERLGNAAGDNSSLECIAFEQNCVDPDAFNEQHFGLLCEGLCRNTSITSVEFIGVHNVHFLSTVGSLFECLAPFLAKREVEHISLQSCDFDPSSSTLVGRVLARCTLLRKISFRNCYFYEDTSADIIKSFLSMKSLESIRIHCIGVWDDTGKWTGWDYLLDHLRFSNHTLISIEYEGGLPRDLNSLLNMNKMEDKNALAIRKGMYFNFLVGKFDAKPYDDIEEELKPKLLPHVLATVSGGENGDGRSEGHRLSALFHCIQNMAADLDPKTI